MAVMTPVITRWCLLLLCWERKLISPGAVETPRLIGTVQAVPNVRHIWRVFSLTRTLHTSFDSRAVAPKVVLQPRGVNSRVGLQYKIQALGVPLTNLARDVLNLAYAGGGTLSTWVREGRSWSSDHGGKGVFCLQIGEGG